MSLSSPHSELSVIKDLARKRRLAIYLVGGFLRDRFLGREVKDFDFAVSKDAVKFARAFAKAVKGAFVLLDAEAGCARVVKKQGRVIWTFDFADFRAPTLKGDLTKRDFSINTLAVDFLTWPLEDCERPFKISNDTLGSKYAKRDLKAGVIRMVSASAFVDDPLRLLRAYSLRAQLGFAIEPKTLTRIKKDKALIRKVSPERVREELFKIFDSPCTAETLKAMDAVRLLTTVIPQLEVMRGVKQGGYHHLDVWKHSLAAVAELEKIIKSMQADPDIAAYLDAEIAGGHSRRSILKFACLLHDIGKPDTKKKEPSGRTSFHGHEHIGRRIARIVAKHLMLSTKERYAIEDIVTLHLRPGYLSNFKRPSEKAIYRFMREAKDEAVSVLLLSTADQHATRGPLTTAYDIRHHERIAFPLINAYFAKKKEKPFVRLINGHDLIKELRLKPGPQFSEILRLVDEAQHLGKIATRAEALVLAEKLAKK